MGAIVERVVVSFMLLACSIQDIKYKKISIWIIGLGALLLIMLIPFSISMELFDRIGGILVGAAVILISKVTGGKIGIGDGLILCSTGIALGLWKNLELIMYALLLAAGVSIILLISRRADRKKSIPFIPFILIGYVGTLILELCV